MASEPFEVTDDNGITVRGGVEVSRHPKGAFYDPTSSYYGDPRYAESHIVYSNTREACTIDRDKLSEAVQKALYDALMKFGIPRPNPAAVKEEVERRIDDTRQQCISNADKYVTNEADSAALAKFAGNAAIAGPDGGMRQSAARHNARRVTENDDPRVPNLQSDSANGPNTAERRPARYLGSRIAGKSVPSGFAAGITAPPLVQSEEDFDSHRTTRGGDFAGGTAFYPADSAQPDMSLVGLVSGKPMSFYSVQPPIWDSRSGSAPNGEVEDWLTRLLQGVGSGDPRRNLLPR